MNVVRQAWAVRVVVLGLGLAVAACGDNGGAPADPPPTIEVASMPAVPGRALDLLFLIDDTEIDRQAALRDRLGVLTAALAIDGRLPDLHIGVATSDLGTTGSLDPSSPGPTVGSVGMGGCAGHGKDGALTVSGAPVTGTFLVDEDDGAGGRARNYTGDLDAVVGQMITVGATGCGFEQHLSAIRRALANPSNAGFRRADASLAIVILADEDDCSVRDAAGFFDLSEQTLGPLQSARCTREGLVCDEPLDGVGAKTGCRPREDSPYLEGLEPFAALADALAAPERVVVAGIFGDPSPLALELRVIDGVEQLALAHSCTWDPDANPATANNQVADPAVRLAAFVDRFASRGARQTLCQTDLAPALPPISLAIKRSLGVGCIDTAALADASDEPGLQPGCDPTDVTPAGMTTAIPRCPADPTCWDLASDPTACPETADHARIVITRAAPPPADTRVDVRCESR
jgi:hypothetical protein